MIEIKVENRTVKNGGGELVCEMGVLPWGDLVMLESQPMLRPRRKRQDVKIKKGALWRPNRELAERTKGDATHALYDDAYLLYAAGEHTIQTEEAEVEEMRRRIAEAVDFSTLMIDYRALTTDEVFMTLGSQEARVDSLALVRDAEKVEARELMRQTLDLVDSTGRNNPMAKAMQSGAANARFRRRQKNARDIRNREIVRTKQVMDVIDDHLNKYRSLWSALSMRVIPDDSSDPDLMFQTKAYLDGDFGSLLAEARGALGLKAAEGRLQEFLEIFQTIRVRPFCKNAAHVVRELKRAIRLCKEGNRAGILSVLRKLRRGIRWVFALDELQMKVILPFSFLLERLKRLIIRERTKNGTFTKGAIVIKRQMAPKLFHRLQEDLKTVRMKIREKCSDSDLAREGIKKDIEMYLGTVQIALVKEDWVTAKDCLRRAARCM